MPVKMRLQRYGKKVNPYYHIVIADGRAPRDGKYIERIGTYNPIPNPAEIKLNFDGALDWLRKGAQPTDTVRAILSYKGVLFKHHLMKGVTKGALTEEQAEAKFQVWLKDKEARIDVNQKSIEEKDRAERKVLFEAETKINEEREAELAKKKADELAVKVKAAKEAAAEIAKVAADKAAKEVAAKVAKEEADDAAEKEGLQKAAAKAAKETAAKVTAVKEAPAKATAAKETLAKETPAKEEPKKEEPKEGSKA